jgi:hypothetical protein
MENDHYPMPRVHCGAKTRHGGPCRQPAMTNGRCRLHGGKSKKGKEHGRYLHGRRTKEAIATQQMVSDLIRQARQLLEQIDPG